VDRVFQKGEHWLVSRGHLDLAGLTKHVDSRGMSAYRLHHRKRIGPLRIACLSQPGVKEGEGDWSEEQSL